MRPRVLIVDDDQGFRSLARLLLEAARFVVLGEAGDGSAAIAAVQELQPDLVLLDVHLPDLDGFEVADRLMREEQPPTVILISSRDASDFRERLTRTRARGFIAKADLCEDAIARLISEQRSP